MRNLSAFQPNGLKQIQLADTPLFSDANLVSYWKLEDENDSKGSNNLTNTSVTFGAAKFNNGATFNAATDKLEIADNASLSITGALTISCWAKINTKPADTKYVVFGRKWTAAGNQRSYGFYLYNAAGTYTVYSEVSSNGTAGTTGSYNYTPDTGWHHYTMVYTPSTSIVTYIDGVVVNTYTTSIPAAIYDSTSVFNLGSDGNGSADAVIDDASVFNKALTAAEVSQLYYSGSTKAYYPLNDGMVESLKRSAIAYWNLDESSGNAVDSIGSNTLNNTGVTFSTGKINNGAVFNSTTDRLVPPSYTPFDFERTDSWSVSCWLYSNSISSNQTIISHQESGGPWKGWKITKQNSGGNHLRFSISNGGSLEVRTGYGDITTGVWQHIVVTYDGSQVIGGIKIYVDGVSKTLTATTDTLDGTTIKNNTEVQIGNWVSSYNLDGTLDEVGVWSRVLSSNEVSRLFNSSTGYRPVSVTDYSGNANHGTETAITYPQGRFGQGARYSTVDSRVSLGDTSPLKLSSSHTFSAWINCLGINRANLDQILFKGNDGVDFGCFALGWTGTNTLQHRINANRAANSPVTCTGTIPRIDKDWHLATATYDGAIMRLYWDARLLNTQATSITIDTTGGVYIGNTNTSRSVDKVLDEVIIESRAWTAKEVETYYRKSVLNYRKKGFSSLIDIISKFFFFFR